ncbi:MAG: pyroglutamyl-peptidase I [Clostridia bacterium]|nr:pyroglutamyl-peptidase I [Clostridia bacterium]
MKLLLTAFEPFGGATVNPAQEALRLVPDRAGKAEILRLEVPVVFGKAIDVVTEAIDRLRPDAVLCIGQAGGRAALTLERIAINVDDASIPDNAGNRPIDAPVVPGAPAAYFATLPIKAITARIRERGLPAALSNTAGTFVCNHLMYGVLHHLAVRHPGVRGGFMHVPYAPAQTLDRPAPSMSIPDIARGIEAAAAAIADTAEDIAASEGATC